MYKEEAGGMKYEVKKKTQRDIERLRSNLEVSNL